MAVTTHPNIILILADDMGFSDVGCFGSEIRTPNIDSMANGGLSFTSMYNCARCCPTRASLLTGLYPHNAGIGHMGVDLGTSAYQGYLRNDSVTIAEVLRLHGYRTLMSGKWHVGGDFEPREADSWTPGVLTHPTPRQRGFDRFYGTLDGAASFFHPHYVMEDDRRIEIPADGYYLTDAISDKAVAMLEDATGDDTPFFLYLAYTAPHWPLHALPEDIGCYRGRYRQGWDAIRTARHEELLGGGTLDHPWQISRRDGNAPAWEDVPEHDWEDARMATYAAQIDRMDQGIGRVLTALDRLGVAGNTVVMFLSDNGGCAEFMAEDGWARLYPDRVPDGQQMQLGNRPSLRPGGPLTFMSYDLSWANVSNAPFRLFKHWVHEGGISTPLIVRWSDMIHEQRIVHSACHVIDILPTLLQAAGADYPTEFGGHPIQALDGESLMPALRGADWTRERPIFWEHEGNAAVRLGEWKLVRKHGHDWELYNMVADRTELTNLAGRNRPKVTQLAAVYNNWADNVGVLDWETTVATLQQVWGKGLE